MSNVPGGCPLSPVMAALYLEPLDSPHGGHRSLLRSLHGRLGDPGPEVEGATPVTPFSVIQYPEERKTPAQMAQAPVRGEAFQERVARLYEQNAPQEEIPRRIEHYPYWQTKLV
jgi:hypothetical protein